MLCKRSCLILKFLTFDDFLKTTLFRKYMVKNIFDIKVLLFKNICKAAIINVENYFFQSIYKHSNLLVTSNNFRYLHTDISPRPIQRSTYVADKKSQATKLDLYLSYPAYSVHFYCC